MPAIIVHSLDHTVAALKTFRDAATSGFVLSQPGAGAGIGAAVFKAMIDEARKHVPEASFTAVLDCGENPGHALAAIRAGAEAIVFEGSPEACSRITNIANQDNCQVLDSSAYTDTPTLDLLDVTDITKACREYWAGIE
jgi:fructose/tagatose bisphosphate aldolase